MRELACFLLARSGRCFAGCSDVVMHAGECFVHVSVSAAAACGRPAANIMMAQAT